MGHFFDAKRSAPLQSLSTIQQHNTAVLYRPRKSDAEPRRIANTPLRSEYVAERLDRVVELSNQGLTVATIADKLSVNPRTVQKYRQMAGLSKPMNHSTEAERLRAKRMLHDGASYQEVSRTLGRAATTIAAWHPGYQLSDADKGLAGALGRQMSKIDRKKHL